MKPPRGDPVCARACVRACEGKAAPSQNPHTQHSFGGDGDPALDGGVGVSRRWGNAPQRPERTATAHIRTPPARHARAAVRAYGLQAFRGCRAWGKAAAG